MNAGGIKHPDVNAGVNGYAVHFKLSGALVSPSETALLMDMADLTSRSQNFDPSKGPPSFCSHEYAALRHIEGQLNVAFADMYAG